MNRSPSRSRGAGAKIWLFRLVAVSGSVLVSLLMIEGFLWARDFIRGEPPPANLIWEFCPSRHHRLVPNGSYRHASYEFDYIWTTNSLGMRDHERPRQKPPGTFRILFLGDSFIEGHGVLLKDAITTRLEASLNEPKRAQTVEVLNAGVFGYSPMLEYFYLREIIDSIQPDLVMVGFFLGNDVGDDHFYTQNGHLSADGEQAAFTDHDWPWTPIEGALDEGTEEHPRSVDAAVALQAAELWPSVKDVLRHSRTVMFLKRRLDEMNYPQRREREFALVRQHRDDIRYDEGLVNFPVLTQRRRFAYWSVSERYLAKIAKLSHEHAAPLVLVAIPPVERLNGETQFDEPYRVLDDVGRKLAAPVIQLLPDFVGKNPYSLYYKFDRHWTAEGHRLAAQVVDRELRSLGELPEKRKTTDVPGH